MISYPLRVLVGLGNTGAPMVTGGKFAGDLMWLIGDGAAVSLNSVGCAYQEEQEFGVTGALRLAECFADSEPARVVLGNNLFKKGIEEAVESLEGRACLLLEDGTRYRRKRPRTRTGGRQDTEDRRRWGNLRAPVRWSTRQPIARRADNCNGKVES